VVSVLARVGLARLQEIYAGRPAVRIQPNVAVEVGRGVTLVAEPVDPTVREAIDTLFSRLGAVVHVPDGQVDAAAACSGVGPAYFALIAEAMTDAAVRHGVPAAQGATIVAETMAGTAALLDLRGHDTLRVRREVASPGGTTARGLAALEREGLRRAIHAAMDDVVGGTTR
jgi:pyrroline-5-carboxylate reductase